MWAKWASPAQGLGIQFLKEPKPQTVAPGKAVTFECETDLEPENVEWLHDGQPLIPDENIQMSSSQLTILVQKEYPQYEQQLGEYQCVVWFHPIAVTSLPGTLSVAALLPFHDLEDYNVSVVEGNTAVIQCQSPYSKPSAKIEYYFNGKSLPQKSGHHLMNSEILVIVNATRGDSGWYACSALNEVTGEKETSKRRVHLTVMTPHKPTLPSFTLSPVEKYLSVMGSTVILECVGHGNPVPRITWSKYGGSLDAERHVPLPFGLMIRQAQEVDQGTYICEADNGLGPPKKVITSLELKEGPKILEGPRDQEVEEGGWVKFPCRSDGNPRPTVTWVFNGKRLLQLPNVRISASGLEVLRVKKNHAGVYQCFAANGVGRATQSALLRVLPQEVTHHSSISSEGGKEVEEVNEDKDMTADGDAFETGKREKGKHKQQHQQIHPEGGRDLLIPPSQPKVIQISNDSVMLYWTLPSPPENSTSLPVTFFKIQWREISPGTKWNTMDDEIPPHADSYAVPNLEAGKAYKFRIAAVYSNNDNRLGKKSGKYTLSQIPADKKPSIAPSIVSLEAISSTIIAVNWEYELDEVPIDGFFIYYRMTTSAGKYTKVTVLGSTSRTHALHHLLPGTSYDVKMQAFNLAGTSHYSAIQTQKTLSMRHSEPKEGNAKAQETLYEKAEKKKIGRKVDTPNISQAGLEFPHYLIVAIVLGSISFLVILACAFCYVRHQCKNPPDWRINFAAPIWVEKNLGTLLAVSIGSIPMGTSMATIAIVLAMIMDMVMNLRMMIACYSPGISTPLM
ncbi:unnamed protein product [Darwinula stevensoni]|uniref:Uncharacterized protein n=1 Tax=Darwinula stevensoni TaxID=69355 RepID=A0A7R9A4L0_9CRUS|nr:unnamed protein product [Darwinula stevensoni]CAG0883608.1 unnamed protein product [Darwinula stevensoni]